MIVPDRLEAFPTGPNGTWVTWKMHRYAQIAQPGDVVSVTVTEPPQEGGSEDADEKSLTCVVGPSKKGSAQTVCK